MSDIFSKLGKIFFGRTAAIKFFASLAAIAAMCVELSADEVRWSAAIDAAARDQIDALAPIETGNTDVEPEFPTRRYVREDQSGDGYAMTLTGVELSAWRSLEIPREARSALRWRFEYEGEIAAGDGGRAGFIFGGVDGANYLSVERTELGSLRVLRWGPGTREPLGTIIWSDDAGSRGKRFRISATYDMREGTLVCSVDGGREHVIELKKFVPSGPMTMNRAGFFGAVREAPRDPRPFIFGRQSLIVLSDRYAKLVHRSLKVEALR